MESFCKVLRLLCQVLFARQPFLMHMKGTKELRGPKQMVREKVWCSGIVHQVATMVKACIPCQPVADKSKAEPLQLTVMPDRRCQEVNVDLCGTFPSTESLLVLEDACRHWPEVDILWATASAALIGHFCNIFAVHGLPEKVVTDNGANLVSEEFENFLATNAIKHWKVMPYWLQANAAVERFNRTLKQTICTAHGAQTCIPSC